MTIVASALVWFSDTAKIWGASFFADWKQVGRIWNGHNCGRQC